MIIQLNLKTTYLSPILPKNHTTSATFHIFVCYNPFMYLSLLQAYLPYITISSLLLTIITLIYTTSLHIKIKKFTKGKDAKSLESLISECVSGINEIQKRNEVIAEHALQLDERISNAIRNIQTIRYKAFEINGSNQSFSIALLNEKGNGVIISSLHHNDRVSTFAKPVEKYESTYDLTDEEKEVLKKSKDEHKKKKDK